MESSNRHTAEPVFDERVEATIRRLRRLAALQPEAWHEVDLTMGQFRALLHIRARQPLAVGQLGDLLAMPLGTASALVGRLARLGLVGRRENPADRRQTLVELAPAGEAMLERVETESIRRGQALFARLSPRGREAWLVVLEEAARAMADEDGDGDGDGDGTR